MIDGATGAPDARASPDALGAEHLVAYVGGYGTDIAWYAVDRSSGALSPSGSVTTFQPTTSFLAADRSGHHLYAIAEAVGRVGAYSIDHSTGALTFINDVGTGGTGPAHVAVDRTGAFVFVANFSDGMVSVLPIGAGGALGTSQQTVFAGANAHMMISDPSNRYVFVPCRDADHVAQYLFDSATGVITANAVPELATASGAGPRHLAFAPDGVHAYLINESDSTMTALALDGTTGQLSALQTLSTRAAGATGANTGAEVWVHPGGHFVYGSNRGDNNIVTFAIDGAGLLSLVGHTSTQGMTPRDFTLDPTGAFLYVANQDSSSVVPFSVDPTTGMLSPAGAPITVTVPAFIGIVALH